MRVAKDFLLMELIRPLLPTRECESVNVRVQTVQDDSAEGCQAFEWSRSIATLLFFFIEFLF